MAKFFTPTKLSENIRATPEGFLLCLNVPIARTGWQDYGPGETPLEVGDDGKVWVFRDKKEVFRPQTIASFQAKSVTIRHPDDFVSPENWKELTHGTSQNVRKGDEKDEDGEEMLLADLLITDEIAIGLINNGLREVSCGYDAEYEETGEGEGRQFNIIGNHIALVEQGRAGETYAIKDHKGENGIMKKTLKELADKLKNLSKTVDEAMSASDTEAAKLKAKKAKASKTSDEDMSDEEKSAYDELKQGMKDLGEKVDKLGIKQTSGDEEEEADDEEEEKPAAKKADKKADDEEEEADDEEGSGMEDRMKALEAAVAKILKSMGSSDEEEEADDEESEEDMSGDEEEESEDEEESEMSEDEEGEEGEESQKKTGDAARIEILTPGKKFSGKDARVNCLKAFAKTEDGKKILKQLGMVKPVFDSKANTAMIFMAASTLLKTKRGTGLSGTKDGERAKKYTADDVDNTASQPMTAEQMNEMNAKHYGLAK